jgi:hypothetical protein
MGKGYLDADADFCRHHGAGEATLDNIIVELLVTVGRVAAFEKALAH